MAKAKTTAITRPLHSVSPEDREIIRCACAHLEHPSLAARLTNVVGTPMEIALKLLPGDWYQRLHRGLERAIEKSLDVAVSEFHLVPGMQTGKHYYRAMCAGAGAVGGFFGLPGLLVELPVTTTLMLSAIADIANAQGEDLQTVEGRMACLEVFALGGRSELDDAADTGYYGLRFMVALSVSSAARHIQAHGLRKQGAPMLVDLITLISSRFGIAVSEKAAAQLVPLIGAATGALVNIIFIHHFQEMARHHFAIRRLERKYSPELVKSLYDEFNIG
ncbi:MAG: EcsC family protein [Gammaproteobacteria bacterium]